MKILVFSDSHGKNSLMNDIIKELHDEVMLVLFLGDCIKDFEDLSYIYPNKQFISVLGNCDFNDSAPIERIVEVGGKKIFMSHGHRYGVKSGHEKIIYEAQKHNADICLYGHSHMPNNTVVNGIYLMNPGSISEPRGAEHMSYGIIDISSGNVEMKIVEIGHKVYTRYI